MSCITLSQLESLDKLARGHFGDTYRGKTMRDIVETFITRKCQRTKKSYALYLNSAGRKVDAFVTHCWDEPFHDFVQSIVAVCGPEFHDPNLWICAFALVQGDRNTIEQQLNTELDKSPFVLALKHAKQFVVVRNEVTDLYTRIWCVCELFYANNLGFFKKEQGDRNLSVRVAGSDKFQHATSSVREAMSTEPKDKKKILQLLESKDKVAYVDALVAKLRKKKSTQRPQIVQQIVINNVQQRDGADRNQGLQQAARNVWNRLWGMQ